MYVRESARGLGVAQALLRRIETELVATALLILRLETGNRQCAARRLYERAGFRRWCTFRCLRCDAASGGGYKSVLRKAAQPAW